MSTIAKDGPALNITELTVMLWEETAKNRALKGISNTADSEFSGECAGCLSASCVCDVPTNKEENNAK